MSDTSRVPAGDWRLRTDETAGRPEWWTPKGGPAPVNKATTLYDR